MYKQILLTGSAIYTSNYFELEKKSVYFNSYNIISFCTLFIFLNNIENELSGYNYLSRLLKMNVFSIWLVLFFKLHKYDKRINVKNTVISSTIFYIIFDTLFNKNSVEEKFGDSKKKNLTVSTKKKVTEVINGEEIYKQDKKIKVKGEPPEIVRKNEMKRKEKNKNKLEKSSRVDGSKVSGDLVEK